jgi:thiol-disulfide isomerase/thioredoxin
MEQKIIMGVVGALVLAAIGIFIFVSPTSSTTSTVPPGTYTAFAECLKDSGATFYGAWWCPHCQAQKRLFGDAAELLPYIECSTTDGKGQLPVCKDAGVTSYPTWEFPDKTRQSGEVPLAVLAEKTSCALPTTGATVELETAGEASQAN